MTNEQPYEDDIEELRKAAANAAMFEGSSTSTEKVMTDGGNDEVSTDGGEEPQRTDGMGNRPDTIAGLGDENLLNSGFSNSERRTSSKEYHSGASQSIEEATGNGSIVGTISDKVSGAAQTVGRIAKNTATYPVQEAKHQAGNSQVNIDQTRRDVVKGTATLGVMGLGGLGADQASSLSSNDQANGQSSGQAGGAAAGEEGAAVEEEEFSREDYIQAGTPLDGLGAYEDKLLEADPLEEDDRTVAEINRLLEENDTVEEEADALTQLLDTENYNQVMAEYHRQKAQKTEEENGELTQIENTAVVNINYGFTANSGETIEIYTVQNGQLQSQPILQKNGGERYIHKPGQNKPEWLKALRDPTNGARFVSQDYQSIHDNAAQGVNEDSATKSQVKEFRSNFLQDWSRVMFGEDDEPRVIPHDVDTADSVFEAMYGDGDAQIIAELSNQYDSKDYDPETLVTVEYDEGWNFYTPEDREMGDPLEGEEKIFS